MRTPTTLTASLLLATAALAASALLAPARAEDPPPAPAATEPQGPNVFMHIDGTAIDAVMTVPGFGTNEMALAKLRSDRGPGAIVAGSGTSGITLNVFVTKEDGGHLTDAEWRKKVMHSEDEMLTFDADDGACFDESTFKAELKQATYRGFVTAAGWCFEIQMSQLGEEDDDALLNKRKFRGYMGTFRVGAYRRGTFADYPAEVVELWHSVMRKHPDWKAAIDAAVAQKPNDWVPAFVAWEAARAFGAPEAEVTALGDKAVALVADGKPTDPKVCFAWASAEEALAVPLFAAGKYKLAIPHLVRALEIVPATSATFRGQIAYDLARAWTKAGSAKDAIPALKTAIEADPKLRAAAPKEPDFAMLKARADFKELVKPPK